MEGSAQLTYVGPDHYQGKMEITTGGETMVMNYEGQKLGQCDGTEMNFVAKKMMADAERQQKLAEQQMAQRCHEMAAEAKILLPEQCKDPADKRTYCEAVRQPENFRRLAPGGTPESSRFEHANDRKQQAADRVGAHLRLLARAGT